MRCRGCPAGIALSRDGREDGVGGVWRARGVAVREASGRAQWARWARLDVRCARSAMGCGRRCEGSHRAASDGWMAARRWASRMRKTEVEGGVFHVKHLYADRLHPRSARTRGPSALAGKLRVPSGDPRPELEVSGGGVQTGVQTEVRAACAGCGRALPQSPSGGGGSFSPLVGDNASCAPSGASLAIANRTLRATLRPRWRAPPNGSAHGASAQRAGVALHLGVLATGGVSLRPCIFALRMHLASRGQRASCAVRVSPLSFFAVDTYQPKV